MKTVGLAVVIAAALAACDPGTVPEADPVADGRPAPSGQATGAEKWNSTNSPTVFATALEYKLASLPKEGAAERTPWPDTYWPTYEDSINARWQVLYNYEAVGKDTLSPA
jgi:hypothetical protein